MNTELVSIYFTVESVRTDPTPYKVYAPELKGVNLLVEVKIPKKYIVNSDHPDFRDKIILTPDGLAYALSQISVAISAKYSNSED